MRIWLAIFIVWFAPSVQAFDGLTDKLVEESSYQFEPIDQDNLQSAIDKALNENDAELQYRLGRTYEEGIGVSIDYGIAAQWYEASADNGFIPAILSLSRIYFYGVDNIPAIPGRAFALMDIAVEAGEPMAFYERGVFYETVEGPNQSFEKAFEDYQEAAKRGVLNALGKLAIFYQYGLGVEPNIKAALKYYKLLEEQADNPNVTEYVKKQRGEIYHELAMAQTDYESRFKWLKLAAREEHILSMHFLALMYEQAIGTEQDYGKAAGWFALASQKDHVPAMTRMGYLYLNGLGVERNFEKALEWFTMAAELGDAEAAWNIGNIYFYGYGMDVDKEKASLWFKRADNLKAKKGNR